MTEYELNKAMARICGIPTHTWDAAYGCGITAAYPFICGGWLRSAGAGSGVRWDPVNRIEQAVLHVMPAITQCPCLVDISFSIDETGVTLHRPFDDDGETDYVQHNIRRVGSDNVDLPRAICEVALEAFDQLEKANAD